MTTETKTPFDSAVGRVLIELAVSAEDQHLLCLTFADAPPVYVECEGDCCSESWWADILGAVSSYGSRIVAVHEMSYHDGYFACEGWPAAEGDTRTRQERDTIYGYTLLTERGIVTLVFRNSSNGYYGGSAFATGTPPACDWTAIRSNDWSA